MSELLELRDRLQDTSALIARLEKDLTAHPGYPSLLLELRSLQRREEELKAAFSEASRKLGLDVCSYRFLVSGPPNLLSLANTLADYQTLISVFFEARKGPRRTAKLPADVWEKTSLDFGYAYTGSTAFVLTMPNERLLLVDSDLDLTIEAIFGVAKSQSAQDVLEYAKKFGPAPIRAFYRWAGDHVKASFDVEIEWRRGQDIRSRALIESQEFERLQTIIASASAEEYETIRTTGMLLGADVAKRSFRILPDEGQEIRGAFSDAISASHTVELPKRYRFVIEKTTKITYSTEEESVSYYLVSVDPV
jgi:hypothetical protein